MPPIKDYFDPKKRQKLLEDALKKSKDGHKRPFAFGVGKSGSFLALDFRNEHSPEKMLKEIKKSEFKDKFIVGTASISGKIISIETVQKKGSIKPKDLKEFLAAGVNSTVSRAVIDGKGDEEGDPTARDEKSGTASPEERQRMRKELDDMAREVDEMLADLAD